MRFDPWVFVKGVLMGAADIVPGVSGGTVAFITGIYERLLFALKSILPSFLVLLRDRHLQRFWQQIDGTFLCTLLLGIVLSALSLAKFITFLIANYPIPLWAGFFGLILASVLIVGQEISSWNIRSVLSLVIGAVAAYLLTSVTPTSIELTLPNIFFSGMLAICAMVLPGISGSFILVILGTYTHVLMAIKTFDMTILMTFVAGCFIGILSIANLLSWAFGKFKTVTLALLTGFMIGALNKVWPWKEVVSYRVNSKGQEVPLIEKNLAPMDYVGDPHLYSAIICASLAFFLVVIISFFARKSEKDLTN